MSQVESSREEQRVLTLIQARTGSTRLPQKILRPLGGRPLLSRMLERVKRASLVGKVVVVTTTDPQDDHIVNLCENNGVEWFRGHPTDLLDRHYQAWRQCGGDVVVKIPSDCPLIDPKVIDRVIENYLNSNADYVSNLHPPTYPDGNDVEVMSPKALTRAFEEALKPHEREHTTVYLWDNPQKFKIENVTWETGRDLSQTHRWVLDYPEDYELIVALFETLYRSHPKFGVNELVELWDSHPEFSNLNKKWLGDAWYVREAKNLNHSVGAQ